MIKNLLYLNFLICGIFTWAQNSFPQNIVIDDAYSSTGVSLSTHVDLDNDSRTDILAVNYRKIFWLKNISTGQNSFSPIKPIYTHPTEILKIESADLNYDGFKDIIFRTSAGIYMMTGIGNTGTFSAPVQINAGNYTDFQILDIDSDGFLDVYMQTQTGAGWKKNSGNGTFPTSFSLFSSPAAPSITIFKDVDGDTKPDFVTKSGLNIRWYKNEGNGVFTLKEVVETDAMGNQMSVGDVDGDGDQDILFYHENGNTVQFHWYKNTDGLGNFTPKIIIGNAVLSPNEFSYNVNRYGMKMADIDMDGKEDIVHRVFWLNNVLWRKNLGNGAFGPDNIITNNAKGIIDFNFADFNNDGKTDVYSLSTIDDKIAWYQNSGTGTFGSQKVLTYGLNSLNSLCSGDIDGDGDIDFLSSSSGSDNKMSWYRNTDGHGTFSEQQIVINNNTTYPSYAKLFDADNDGDNDFIVKYQYVLNNITYYRISLFKNDGSGNFIEQIVANALPKDVLAMAVADIDNDGDYDLIAAYRQSALMKFINNGSGAFSAAVSFFPIPTKYPLAFKALDMDGDGDMDLIATYIGGEIEWYENTDGLGNFSVTHVLEQLFNPTDVTPEDVDGDGDIDILFVSYGDSLVGWFQNNGNGTYTKKLIPGNANHPRSITAYDIDGDGVKDIVTNSFQQPKLRWYKNLGSGNFGTPQLITNNIGRVIAFNIADYNGDGKPDLAAGSDSGENFDETNMITWFETGASYQNKISGKVRFDEDNNGCSPTDTGTSMVLVKTQNAQHSYATFTDDSGAYSLVANQSQFTTSVSSPLPDYTVSPANQVQNFTALGETQNADFCLLPDSVFKNLEVSVYPLEIARPGFETVYKIIISNKGSQKVSGQLIFNFNQSKMTFVSSTTAPDSQSAGNLNYNYFDLSPFHSKTIEARFLMNTIPATNIGDLLEFTATADVPQDITPADNSFVLKQNVVGSYDPNDIQVLEGPQILLAQKDDYLHYIIRFQNTGNYHAQRVRVKNVLDDQLDWSTLTLEGYSHPNRAVITNGNNVEFIFDAIYLPGSDDEPNSHGYVTYKIKPKSNVAVGDIFTNKAEIFFDYNPPIVTNTVNTEIVDQVLSTASVSIPQIAVYPNPTTGLVYIKSPEKIKKITVHNLVGQQVLQNENQSAIDFSSLLKGIYIIKVESGKQVHTSKVIRE